MSAQQQKAVVLLSGGIDSTVSLALARSEGFACIALSVLYGQRHKCEIKSARAVSKSLGVERHATVQFNLRAFGGSALTSDAPVPKNRSKKAMLSVIPATYVPARNTIFLAFALSFAEAIGARDIFIGANAVDHAGYPDCRPKFLRAFEGLASCGTKAGVLGERFKIHAPLVKLSKSDIIKRGISLGVDFSLTHSCFDPTASGIACGECDACRLRLDGFKGLGLNDPIRYASLGKHKR